MKVSIGWLREWIDLPGSVEELGERLTVGGLEIEDELRTGPDLSAVRVGHVLERESHPNADRLSLCRVDLGEGEPLDIVCGAPNVAAGQKVAVATHGTTLPDGLKIKRSKIRGVTSNGMICSTRELGLGDEHQGILVLDPEAPVGAPLPEVLPAGDVVLDLEVTPNRGDWVSMLGIAREVRAHFGGALRMPPLELEESGDPAAADVRIEIDDRAGCHRYVARIVRGVRVGDSPDWLCRRLEAAGLRPVNNVVDVTNLVMLELGQPLHAFDLARLRGGVVRVRAAGKGEKLLTLDGQTRELLPEDLVIADGEGGIAIAGVMGGAESEVRAATTDVLIESAHFHPTRVRRTARRLGLHSDASYRFERGVDPEGVGRAADRAARLIQEIAGGSVAEGRVEAVGDPLPPPPEIRLEPERVNRLLGTALSRDEVVALLARVDISAEVTGDGALRCRPPSYRSDVAIPEDLVEEVARIHGYDRIAPSLPEGPFAGVEQPAWRLLARSVRDAFRSAGLSEIMTFPGCRPEDLDGLRLPDGDPRRRAVAIANPLQASHSQLRSSLVPSLLQAARYNFDHRAVGLALFEVSRVFLARDEAGALPEEHLAAGAVIGEETGEALFRGGEAPVFFRAKGVAERVLAETGRAVRFRPGSDEPYLHPGGSGEFESGGRTVGRVGEIHPETAAHFGIEENLALVLLDLEALLALEPEPLRYREVSRHPSVRRDLAVLLDRAVPAGDVLEALRGKGGDALAAVTVFDRYEGKGVPEGKVSLAFRLVFQRADRTLTDAEVAKATDRLVRILRERFGGELR